MKVFALQVISPQGKYMKAIELGEKKLFAFTNINSFVFDLTTLKMIGDVKSHDEYSEKEMSEAGISYNSTIQVMVSDTIYFFNADGSLSETKKITVNDVPQLENRQSGFSVVSTNTGKTIISCILNNGKILFISLENNNLKSSVFEPPEEQGIVQDDIDCQVFDATNFFCFYFFEKDNARKLGAGVFKVDDLSLVKFNSIDAPNGRYVKSTSMTNYGKLNYFGFCFMTLSGEVPCGLFNNTFFDSMALLDPGSTNLSKLSFTINKFRAYYQVVAANHNQISSFSYNSNFNPIGQLKVFKTSISEQKSVFFMKNPDDSTGLIFFDREEGGILMKTDGNKKCENFCIKNPNDEASIIFTFPFYIDSPIRFEKVKFDNGEIKIGSINTQTGEEEFVDNPTDIFYAGGVNFKYIFNSDPKKDTIFFQSFVSTKDTSGSISCYIYIGNGHSTTVCDKCKSFIDGTEGPFYKDQCVLECPSDTEIDYSDGKCYECVHFSKYLYKDHCIKKADIPSNAFISDTTTNLVKDCALPCTTCKDREDYCLTCTKDYDTIANNGKCTVTKPPEPTDPSEPSKPTQDPVEIETNEPLAKIPGEMKGFVADSLDHNTRITGTGFVIEIKDMHRARYKQSSQIDFGNCENILRNQYGVNYEDKLIVAKVDIERENSLTDQVEYEIYDYKGNQLDLSYCKDGIITIIRPIKDPSKINKEMAYKFEEDGIDIFDSKDTFFSDVCFPYSNEDEKDIPISDRRTDIYQNVSLCDEGCEYDKINLEENTVQCKCKVKESLGLDIDAKFFYFGLRSLLESSNFGVVLCYNLVFSSDIITHNYGFFFFGFLFILHIPLIIVYCVKGISPIQRFLHQKKSGNPPKYTDDDAGSQLDNPKQITVESNPGSRKDSFNSRDSAKIPYAKRYNKPFIREQTLDKNSKQKGAAKKSKFNIYEEDHDDDDFFPSHEKTGGNSEKNSEICYYKSKDYPSSKTRLNIGRGSKKGNLVESKKNVNQNYQKHEKKISEVSLYSTEKLPKIARKDTQPITMTSDYLQTKENMKADIICHGEEKVPSNDFLDDFTYEEAILYDTRSFLKCYYLILLPKQNILRCFVYKSPLELRIAKIMLFIFGYSMDLAFNAAFYMESMISERYHYEGTAGFLFTLQNNIYSALASCLVSSILMTILNLLSNSKKKLEAMDPEKRDINLEKKILKCLKIKLFFFILCEMALMIFFWYYVSAFCGAFQSSQLSWLEGGLISFLIGNLIPFGIALPIAIIHRVSLVKKLSWLFKFSIWLYAI